MNNDLVQNLLKKLLSDKKIVEESIQREQEIENSPHIDPDICGNCNRAILNDVRSCPECGVDFGEVLEKEIKTVH